MFRQLKSKDSQNQPPREARQNPSLSTTVTPEVRTTAKTPEASKRDEFLGPPKCLDKKWTRALCGLVFCPPWERCVQGQCVCKPPYLCPLNNVTPVCGRDKRTYRSYCQAMSLACHRKKSFMSHFGEDCDANGPKFKSSIAADTGLVKIFVPDKAGVWEELLVCQYMWDMAAANVACKEHEKPLGAASANSLFYNSLSSSDEKLPDKCVSVRCQGYESSLAECEIHNKVNANRRNVSTVTCYKEAEVDKGEKDLFHCVNGKRVSLDKTCDGVDDCVDRSDEMCCKKCRNGAFRCKTGVCVHGEAINNGVVDCLDGSDEVVKNTVFGKTSFSREHLESKLYCGRPNMTTVDDTEEEARGRSSRHKRVVGGIPAKPTQIQWQVALEENGKIDCGGAFIGGCWVLTAAHCVRPNPYNLWIKFSLWKMIRPQGTTDIVPVEEVFIHPNYNPRTYENDIALVRMKTLPFTDICLVDNPAVSAVCVPWSPHIFQPNHTCSISGWGRTETGRSAQVLLWANVSLIDNCERFYGDRFTEGMMCAGDLEGSVDSCQGDSGGPLVCEDELGISYLWGIVSWGERCGTSGFPGVYTQVAHYFEWIRLYTGWPAVTKYNS
ncbi:complement factor I [Pholidichthys leucotaenia]